jgi:uncharacterized protein YndB with AHSA1/START domain
MATARKHETTFATPSDREVVVTRVVDAPRTLVWDVYTNAEHVRQWMLGPEGWTMPVCEIDLRAGGAYRFGWRNGDGAEMTISGEYREVSPPERLVSTESWGAEWPETLNTIVFTEENGATTITTTVLYPSRDARDAALETGMTDGMATTFDRLDDHLRDLT